MPKARFLMFTDKSYFPKSGRALDVGCHEGRESKELLARGFEVDAVDLKVVPGINNPKFHFQQANVKDFEIKKDTYDIVLAYYVLPFLKTKELVQKSIYDIRNGLNDKGIAIITLFGDKHEWKGKTAHLFLSEEEAKKMIGPYVDIHEVKETRKTMEGSEAFWHSWDFVIQK